MLLELAIGDAYGAGFEYADEMIALNDLSRYVKHPRHRLMLIKHQIIKAFSF